MSFAFLKSCNPQWTRPEQCSHNRAKVCKTCGESKPVSEFYDKLTPKGTVYRHGSCKACMKLRVQISRRAG
jgi:hypothetical protein